MITPNDIILIDKFINEELEPLELRGFQQRVHDDFEFSHEVREHIAAVKSIRSFSSLYFMDEINKSYPNWVAGGHNKYSPSIDTTKIMLRIFIPAIILGLSYGIYSIVKPAKHSATPIEVETKNEDTLKNSEAKTETIQSIDSTNQLDTAH